MTHRFLASAYSLTGARLTNASKSALRPYYVVTRNKGGDPGQS